MTSIEILEKISKIKLENKILSTDKKLEIQKLQQKLNEGAINPIKFR